MDRDVVSLDDGCYYAFSRSAKQHIWTFAVAIAEFNHLHNWEHCCCDSESHFSADSREMYPRHRRRRNHYSSFCHSDRHCPSSIPSKVVWSHVSCPTSLVAILMSPVKEHGHSEPPSDPSLGVSLSKWRPGAGYFTLCFRFAASVLFSYLSSSLSNPKPKRSAQSWPASTGLAGSCL
jgi:hypothetical protein